MPKPCYCTVCITACLGSMWVLLWLESYALTGACSAAQQRGRYRRDAYDPESLLIIYSIEAFFEGIFVLQPESLGSIMLTLVKYEEMPCAATAAILFPLVAILLVRRMPNVGILQTCSSCCKSDRTCWIVQLGRCTSHFGALHWLRH